MWSGLSSTLKSNNKVSPEAIEQNESQKPLGEVPTIRKVAIEEPTPPVPTLAERYKDVHFLTKDDHGEIEGDQKIVLNIGGQRHETLRSTLLKYPRTLLYRVVSDPRIHRSAEVFVDHHPEFFPAILLYYRTGELHIPKDICTPLVTQELNFWGIDENEIEPCCWVTYNHYHETQSALEQFEADVDEFEDPDREEEEEEEEMSLLEKWKRKIWIFLIEPSSSTAAKVWAILILGFVVLSIAIFCLETHPYFKRTGMYADSNVTLSEVDHLIQSLTLKTSNIPMTILVCIDQAINILFLLEYIAKFLTAPHKVVFVLSLFSIIEILCLVPYYVGLIISFCHPSPNDIIDLLNILFFTKSIRILRIFLLMKHFKALKILVYTLKASTKELLLLVLILVIAVVVFACLIFYAEQGISSGNKHMFTDIPTSFWWALVTITTVGYGDHVPNSWAGYIVGAFCSTSGVLIIALTVPIIVSNFSLYYTYAESTSKLRERKKQKAAESKRRALMAKTQLLGIGARMAAQMMSKKHKRDGGEEKNGQYDPTIPEDKQNLQDDTDDIVEEEMRRTLGSSITIAPTSNAMGHGGSPIRSAVTYEKKTVNYFQVQREKINISLHDMSGE